MRKVTIQTPTQTQTPTIRTTVQEAKTLPKTPTLHKRNHESYGGKKTSCPYYSLAAKAILSFLLKSSILITYIFREEYAKHRD